MQKFSLLLNRLRDKIVRIPTHLKSSYQKRRDLHHPTFHSLIPPGSLQSHFPLLEEFLADLNKNVYRELGKYYIDHRFDLLGSGWVVVKYGMICRGLEGYVYNDEVPIPADPQGKWLEGRINPSNLKESQSIWSLVDPDYQPIDWQRDFKSGYRWSEHTWFRDIPFGHMLGVDVKVPWELARMQHLPQIALAFVIARSSDDAPLSDKLMREFRNQILDFMATNPPRFGVNWHSTMDVSIRMVNWLVAYDLFRVHGAKFDADFERLFIRSIYEHALHTFHHLEWSFTLRGNHYLSNITGLIFAAAFLPRTPETEMWLAFANKELIAEVEQQFTKDGANFEASTSYHCLSAECVTYATAIVTCLRRTDPVFPKWYMERLEKMAEFTMHITKPNHHIVQIGDNDSGRLLKIDLYYRTISVREACRRFVNLKGYSEMQDDADYLLEDCLDHRNLVSAINGLFERADFAEFAKDRPLEYFIIRKLAGIIKWTPHEKRERSGQSMVVWKKHYDRFQSELGRMQKKDFEIPIGAMDNAKPMKLFAYPHFGAYIFRSPSFYLLVRCGPIGQNGIGGHAHNDQLMIEIYAGGREWFCDPGSYLYTPLPERRNHFRSVVAHAAPRLHNRESGTLHQGLFQLGDAAQAECIYFGVNGFIGKHMGYGKPIWRIVELLPSRIRITDLYDGIEQDELCDIVPYTQKEREFSAGYGWRECLKTV